MGNLILIWLAIVVVGGIGVLGLRWKLPSACDPLFPRQRHREVPWTLVTIVLLLFVSIAGELALAQIIGLKPPPESTKEAPPIGDKDLWHFLLARLFQISIILFVLLKIIGAQAYQAGLTSHRWIKNVTLGYLFWLVMTPITFGIWALLIQYEPAQLHAFEKLGEAHVTTVFLVLPLVAVLIGPFAEELLFRGVIQPWMTKFPEMADFVFMASLIMAIWLGLKGDSRWPLVFLVTAGPGYLAFELLMRRWLPKAGAARAIYSTSLLFAAIHGGVWPSPIPLFFLSLGLGFLGYRTQSLVGPVVVHSLFNVISTVKLMAQ